MPDPTNGTSTSLIFSGDQFTGFGRLPVELRRQIWRLCLPDRVVELDCPFAPVVFGSSPDGPECYPCSLDMNSRLNGLPPLITRVCRESRRVAFEKGSFLTEVSDSMPEDAQWNSGNSRTSLWIDPPHDSNYHLNWTPAYTADFGADRRGLTQPLKCLRWYLETSKRPDSVGSLMAEYLDPTYAWASTPSEHSDFFAQFRLAASRHSATDQQNLLDILAQRSKWLVIMHTIIIHASSSTISCSGLFGLLGDAPVQAIDIADQDKINAMYEMADQDNINVMYDMADQSNPDNLQRSGIFCCQNLQRKSPSELQERLSKMVQRQLGQAQFSFQLRPAIMFRACPLMCDHGNSVHGTAELQSKTP